MHLAATNNALSDLFLFFLIGFSVVMALIGLSISAVILKLACRTAGVDVPDTGKAMVVSFLESLVATIVYFAAVAVLWFAGAATKANQTMLGILFLFTAIAIAFVVPAGLYVPMLRVTFPRGLLIAVLRYVITIAIGVVIAYLVFAFSGKTRLY